MPSCNSWCSMHEFAGSPPHCDHNGCHLTLLAPHNHSPLHHSPPALAAAARPNRCPRASLPAPRNQCPLSTTALPHQPLLLAAWCQQQSASRCRYLYRDSCWWVRPECRCAHVRAAKLYRYRREAPSVAFYKCVGLFRRRHRRLAASSSPRFFCSRNEQWC